MICLRCGYCCKNMLVGIVKEPSLGIIESNIIGHIGDGTPCPHLIGEKAGEYSCAVHDYPWYNETPCFSHTQIEQGNTNCRMGEYILKLKK